MKFKRLQIFVLSVATLTSSCQSTTYEQTTHALGINNVTDLYEYFKYTGTNRRLISGHRGGAKKGFPENCIETFEHVLAHTPATFEIDPRLTKDSVIVLMHDATLDRTTNGTGKLSDYTLEEVKKLRLKDSEGYLTHYRIPTLEEVIEWAKGKTVVILDKKDVPSEMTAGIIRKHNAESHVMITVHTADQAKFYYEDNPKVMFEAFVWSKEALYSYEEAGIPWSHIMAYVGPENTPEARELCEMLHERGAMCMISAAPKYDKLDSLERVKAYQEIFNSGVDIIESDRPTEVAEAQTTDKNLRTLIVIFDGLRPDYITSEYMPHVYALKKKGSYGLANHSVFPTVTRVNASSYATGSYPRTHGLMGNTVYFPEVDKAKGLNTGDASELIRITEATHDKLLTTVSLGELLQQAGTNFMVFSSGSSGQAYLQNHKVSGGIVVNPMLILPSSFKKHLINNIGQPPAHAKPNRSQHEWATNALLHYGLTPGGPLVSVIWFSDPDGTAHSNGIGSPLAMESIKNVDSEFGRIISAMESKGIIDSYNIVISTDHGFVTDVGTEGLGEFLIEQGLKKDKDSDDVVLAGGAIYIKDRDKDKIKKIVSALQAQEWVGAIFTESKKKDPTKGWIDGTLSFETIHWNHPVRAADILVDYNWDNRKNAYGYEGASFSKGVAGHGGSSPYEIHIPLIVSGPSFKKYYESSVPTSNVDIVPTILKIHGLAIPEQMDGRVMYELLEGVKANRKNGIKKEIIEASVKHAWGTYHVMLERSLFDKHFYVNYTKVSRDLVR